MIQQTTAAFTSRPRGNPPPALDPDADVAEAFEAYHAELHAFVRRSTRDEAAAEDLVHEAYLRLAAETRAGRRPENPRAWLYRVAGNLAVSRARRHSAASTWLARQRHDPQAVAESPEATVLRREGRSELENALTALSSDARTALLLSSEGFNGTEIAAAIGRSHGATRSLLTRARVIVRIGLEQGSASTPGTRTPHTDLQPARS